jgi:hypothetical protein
MNKMDVSESLPEAFALRMTAESAACGYEVVEAKESVNKSCFEIFV